MSAKAEADAQQLAYSTLAAFSQHSFSLEGVMGFCAANTSWP